MLLFILSSENTSVRIKYLYKANPRILHNSKWALHNFEIKA
jgi:hypothetical protein